MRSVAIVFKSSGLSSQLRKLPRGPDLSELQQLLSQALEQRGKVALLAWRGSNLMPFHLEVVCNLKNANNAQWRLYTDQNGKHASLFDYTSCDVLLVYNLVLSSCLEAQQHSARSSSTKLPAATEPLHESERQGAAATVQTAANVPPPPQPPASVLERDTGLAAKTSRPEPEPEPEPEPKDLLPREGSLSKISVPELLNLIGSAKGSGRLDIRSNELTATVFIQDGQPEDATAGDAIGDEAMIVLLTWQEGSFEFESRVLRNNHTVHASIESLLKQSKQLSEHLKYLKEAGMLPTSILSPKSTGVQEKEFIERASDAAPCDISILSRVYCSLRGNQSLDDLVRELSLSRLQLVHIVYHLLVKDLIKLGNDPRAQSNLILEPRVIDNAAIQSIMMSLRRIETGLFNYPAFLYFLEQEYLRSFRSRTSFSVVVFEMRQKKVVDGETVRRVLPDPAIMDAVLRISQLKRHVDLLAHYDAYDYALLLPNTRAQGAAVFVNRFVKAITERPLAGGIDSNQLLLACGISSVPDDFKELSALLGAADLAMNQARQESNSLVLYRDIKNLVTVPPTSSEQNPG